MSLHDDIVQATRAQVLAMQEQKAVYISPSALAIAVHQQYANGDEDEHIAYCAIEHCKQIARKVLANRFDDEGKENRAYQGELFSNALQEYYPLPRKSGEEPQYKQRERLTYTELTFNIESLQKSAQARLAHARALEAYRDSKGAVA